MKKTYPLIVPDRKPPRVIEGIKHEIRKYLKRERRKALPKDVDFWDFDCKFGDNQAEAKIIHLAEIDDCIDAVAAKQSTSFYLEILAKPARRMKKA